MKKTVFFAFALIIALAACAPKAPDITDFNSCAAAGNPIQESSPRRCTANGNAYTEVIDENMYGCSVDSDCILVSIGSCCDFVAVNKAYKDSIPEVSMACEMMCLVEGRCHGGKCAVDSVQGNICTEEEKKATMCTLEYAPVCGDDGVTYGNKCGACASEMVISYTPGECLARPKGSRQYLSKSPEECSRMGIWQCEDWQVSFSDETGCGCQDMPD